MYAVTVICWALLLVIVPHAASYRPLKRFKKQFGTCKADQKEPWSYRGRNGPKYWGETYPECNGKEQSPIAIKRRDAVSDEDLQELEFNNYNSPVTTAKIENNGHTVQLTPTDDVSRTIVIYGSNYRMVQLHFHWGDVYYKGAEHTIDGIQHSMEMHLVHQNSDNQIAVVGVFFQEQARRNSELQKIIDSFQKVMYKDTSTQLNRSLNLKNLLPENPSTFYRYAGSLTTPPCSEGVTWSVLPKPLPVGHDQMAEFRKLYSAKEANATSNCRQSNNFRPVQPLNMRTVSVSQ